MQPVCWTGQECGLCRGERAEPTKEGEQLCMFSQPNQSLALCTRTWEPLRAGGSLSGPRTGAGHPQGWESDLLAGRSQVGPRQGRPQTHIPSLLRPQESLGWARTHPPLTLQPLPPGLPGPPLLTPPACHCLPPKPWGTSHRTVDH